MYASVATSIFNNVYIYIRKDDRERDIIQGIYIRIPWPIVWQMNNESVSSQ